MTLNRLVYISDATRPMSDQELRDLVSHCRDANAARGISGILLYSGGHFMQLLEGQGMQISSLFAKISADPRHTDVRQLVFQSTPERIFPEWGMQLANAEQSLALDRAQIDQLLIRMRLKSDPDPVNHAITLLREFRRQVMSTRVA